MDAAALVAQWRAEEEQPFSGWDFAHIRDRAIEQEPPWSYAALARDALRGARSALDLGTGGGEVLAELRDSYPPRIVATEAYAPNLLVARERLAPLGVDVVPYEATETSAPIPFPDRSFDVVLSRHEAYDPTEVARVLAPGGLFLTQQVLGTSLAELQASFGAKPQWPTVTLAHLARGVRDAGLTIDLAEEWSGTMTFVDVGAVVYFLRAIPWEVPGFSVERHREALLRLQERLDRDGALRYATGRFVIRARRSV